MKVRRVHLDELSTHHLMAVQSVHLPKDGESLCGMKGVWRKGRQAANRICNACGSIASKAGAVIEDWPSRVKPKPSSGGDRGGGQALRQASFDFGVKEPAST